MGQGFPTKLEYSNNGLQCIGPGFVVNGLVSEFCPNNVTISFETARLIMRRSETSVRFPNGFPRLLGRCISCESQYELNQFFRKKRLRNGRWADALRFPWLPQANLVYIEILLGSSTLISVGKLDQSHGPRAPTSSNNPEMASRRRSTAGVEYIRGSGTRQITTWSFDVSRP
jgi:hypothetical protein